MNNEINTVKDKKIVFKLLFLNWRWFAILNLFDIEEVELDDESNGSSMEICWFLWNISICNFVIDFKKAENLKCFLKVTIY